MDLARRLGLDIPKLFAKRLYVAIVVVFLHMRQPVQILFVLGGHEQTTCEPLDRLLLYGVR